MSDLDLSTPDRVYWQYRDKEKLNQIIGIYQEVFNSIKSDINKVRALLDINKASGRQLDIIGAILDLERPYITINGVTSLLSDDYYMILMRAKAAKGSSNTTLDNYVEMLEYIINSKVYVVDNMDMTFRVIFETEMTDEDKFFFDTFDVIPTPMGVRYLGYTETESVTLHGRNRYAERYKQHTTEVQ